MGAASLADMLATLRSDVLLVKTPLQAQIRSLEIFLLRKDVKSQAQIQKRLNGYVDVSAVLTCNGTHQLAVERLVHDTFAACVIGSLRTLRGLALLTIVRPPPTVDLMEFFRKELKELMGVLLLVTRQLLVSLPLGEPETGKDVGG